MLKVKKNILTKIIGIFATSLFIFGAFIIYFKLAVIIKPPVPDDLSPLMYRREKAGNDFYKCKNNWLRKSKSGLWEMYIEGKPFEMGIVNGLLAKELIHSQEKAFVNEIKKMVPSDFYRSFLKYFVAWFNRNIPEYIEKDYQLEIYGISKSASDEFSDIGNPYMRILNYHAAHDIGHAIQNMNIVGCTSFAAWNSFTNDSSLIIGRNFDFYVSDDFAKDKIVCFCKPDKGYKFMYITWGGMIGVVSGMNEKGLTVTLNAAKSGIPFSSKTPVSILAREILQYSKNIHDAYEIAKKHDIFISESFLIGSAEDNKAAIIEKSNNNIDLVYTNKDYLICTNHFQGNSFKNEQLNIENIKNSSSMYRYKRMEELMKKYKKIDYKSAAEILRDRKGLNNTDIGMGNEKSVNQLIAHHSIIFNPSKLLVWVSAGPFQEGSYIAYDLKKIFSEYPGLKNNIEISEDNLSILPDTFLFSANFKKFEKFKQYKKLISDHIKNDESEDIDDNLIKSFIESNPQYYYVYSLAGDYYRSHGKYKKAIGLYNLALKKEITTIGDNKRIHDALKKCYENE